MAGWSGFWAGLSRAARVGLVTGAVVIVASVGALGWNVLRTPYGVLFADLSDRDMAAMTAELDKQKMPYRIAEDGRALLVPQDQVHKVRLKLMGAPVPLHGAVGFELFNTSDFAMTEFAQKVNYQRALQGELMRTILSLEEVESARVHLALPEQGLFRKSTAKAKASVTLRMRPGRRLAPEQVTGIQRLVAASVNDVQSEDVAVLDEHGVVLSRAKQGEDGLGSVAELDLKQGTETYLPRKAMAVVDRMFGPGEALVSIDAVFEQDQVKVTTEEVVPAKGATDDTPAAGVIVRERVSTREAGGATADRASGPSTVTQETEYQTGKRVHQVVTPAGQLKRLQVAVVLRRPLDDMQIEKVRELVAAAVGLNAQRGDRIAVHSMPALASSMATAVQAPVAGPAVDAAPPTNGDGAAQQPGLSANEAWQAALLLVAAALAIAVVARSLRRRPQPAASPVGALDMHQRQQALAQLESWLSARTAPARPPGGM